MADATTNTIVVVLVIVMIVVTWLELRVMRSRSKKRKQRVASRPEELQDEAHNALITTRAIASTLAERGGIRSEDVDAMLREAQMAYNRRNYRVAIDLTKSIKDRLVSLKARRAAQGDLANLQAPPTEAEEEPTTKELLQRDYPPNLAPSKFAISMAESVIEASEASGGDVVQARVLLATARSRFDAKDYSGALTVARQAERSAKGELVAGPAQALASPPSGPSVAPELTPAAVPAGSACPSCGAPLKAGDAFCRKCGAQAVLTNCPKCSTALQADDVFCRKCGTRVEL